MPNFSKNHPILHIVLKNTFTLFNLVNVILALMVAFVGSFKHMLFIFIAIANTLISIINEIRAYKIVQKMRLIAEQKPTVLRDGKSYQVSPEEVKKGDIIVLALGDQILYDSTMQEGTLEVNEAFITGEQDNIKKHSGDELISGSFVVAGSAKARVEKVGEENSLTKIETEARHLKTADSKLFTLMNRIVKYISYTLIPVGALLLWSRFRTESDTATAITSTVAGLINMIPEGLILLTSSVLALATIRLSRKKVLVQDLYSIETLARVDTICLDKTGTLTTGKMTVKDFILPDGTILENPSKAPTPAEKSFLRALESILRHQIADNDTASALKKKFLKRPKFDEIKGVVEDIPFSSDRKYSGIRTAKEEYLLGATDFITKDKEIIKKSKTYAESYRILSVFKNQELLGFVRLEDEIRKNAKEIVNYFYDNDIEPKIISGDGLQTVQSIAETVGVKNLNGIDLSTVKAPNFSRLVKDYTIFTRVKPAQKKQLVAALKKQNRTVAMTGDGVNDILAMKEADCSIAIGEGSDAARRSAKLVLLDSDFAGVPSIIDEGRQSINNLERSTSLFLAKTVYATILAVLFVVLPLSYPFSPIEMSLLSFACIGFPGLALALEHNTKRIKDKFIYNIKHYSVPTGLAVAASMLILSIVATVNNFDRARLTTFSAIIVFVIDFCLIFKISKPLNFYRALLMALILAIFLVVLFVPFLRQFFEFTLLF